MKNKDNPCNITYFVVGATASGKSDYAVRLAHELDGEIVSADSVQIFRCFDIGSAKITLEEQMGIPHHLIDFLEPTDTYTVADYARDARNAIADIFSRGKTPIVCGGTGLYINSLLYDLDDLPPADERLREELNKQSLEELLERARRDQIDLKGVNLTNKRRVIRGMEIYLLTGKPMGNFNTLKRSNIVPVIYHLSPPRELLYEKINLRTHRMIEAGMVEETREIVERFGRQLQALGSIGYREALMYLDGHLSMEQLIASIQLATRHYAKRQGTWFRRYASMKEYQEVRR